MFLGAQEPQSNKAKREEFLLIPLFLEMPCTVHPKIYNLQYTGKIWLKSTIFAQKSKIQSTNLQDFGQKNMQSTRNFQNIMFIGV